MYGSPSTMAALVLALPAGLAGQSQARLAEQRDGKLQSPFLKDAAWILRFDQAKAAARRTGRPILAYFTRSDERCFESVQLETGALAGPEFTRFSARVVPYCHITSKVKTDPDQQLFRTLGLQRWPQLVFLDADGRILFRVRGERLADLQKGLAELEELRRLEQRAAAGDRAAGYPLLKKQLELGLIGFPAARKARQRLPKLGRARQAELAPLLLQAEVRHLVANTGPGLPARARTGERFLRMRKAGAVPTGEAGVLFWQHILAHAELRRKPALYEEVLDTLKHEYPQRDFAVEEQTLRKLRRNPLESGAFPHP